MTTTTIARPAMEAIEARWGAATKGPWIEGQPGNFRVYGPANMGRQSGPLIEGLGVNDNEILRANISFVAHARQDIPALITYIRSLEKREKERNRPSDLRGTVG